MIRINQLHKELAIINTKLLADLSVRDKKRLMKAKMHLEGRIREASRTTSLNTTEVER